MCSLLQGFETEQQGKAELRTASQKMMTDMADSWSVCAYINRDICPA